MTVIITVIIAAAATIITVGIITVTITTVTITTVTIITITVVVIATQGLVCRKQRTVTTQVIRMAGENLKLRTLRESPKK